MTGNDALYPGTVGVDSDSSDVPDLSGAVERSERSETTEPSEPSKLSKLFGWIRAFGPDNSDTDGDGRTGFLSTYVEFHALAIGMFLGFIAAKNGDVSVILAVIGGAAAGSRVQLGIPNKYLQQAKKELPHTLFGFGATYFAFQVVVSNGYLIS